MEIFAIYLLKPIDVHTPMWLWSRGKFEYDIDCSQMKEVEN